MAVPLTVSQQDILHQVKLSFMIPSLVESVILRKTVTVLADEFGFKIENDELQEAADRFRVLNKLASIEQTSVWLDSHVLSVDDFEEFIHLDLLVKKLASYLFADKVEPYFFERQLDYSNAIIYEILLNDQDLAFELFYAIQEKEMTFFEAAYLHLQTSEARLSSGYRGRVSRQDLKPEISAAVFAAKPPQLLMPIETKEATYLIFVEEIIEPVLTEELRQTILSELFKEWARDKAKQIEVKMDFETLLT